MTNYIFEIVFILLIFGVYVKYSSVFFSKLNREKELFKKAKAKYVSVHIRNFLLELTFIYIPVALIYLIVVMSLHFTINENLNLILVSVGYPLFVTLVLTQILVITFTRNDYRIFIYEDQIIFLSDVVPIKNIYAIDFNDTKKHVYINYVLSDGTKELIKLR